jgi:hypothetical protein
MTKASDEFAYKENAKIIEARRKALRGSGLRMIKNRNKKILHPIDLLRDLEGYWDWSFELNHLPTLSSIATYLDISKDYIHNANKSPVSYSYYEIRDHMDDILEVLPIYSTDDLETTLHGRDIDISHLVDIERLIENYEQKHFQKFTDEEKAKIKSFQKSYIKRFHKEIISKKRYKKIVSVIHKVRAAKTKDWKGRTPNFRANAKSWKNFGNDNHYKEIYCTCVLGSVIVAPSIRFADVLQIYQNVAETELQQAGLDARNPAFAIFMLLNNSGHNPRYQNKIISEMRQTTSELEEAESQKRLDDLFGKEMKLIE